MSADGQFGMDADDHKHNDDLRQPADRSAMGIRHAETRDHIEYFEVLQAADQRHRSEDGNPARAADTRDHHQPGTRYRRKTAPPGPRQIP